MPFDIWQAISAASGVIYFSAWGASFYPQLLLNHRRKSSLGLSPDFTLVNPIGFFCLTVYTYGLYLSPTARRQYAERHDGHLPQVSRSDLAFAMHALVLSSATFAQAAWFFHRTRMERARPRPSSRSPLLGEDQADAPTGASLPTRVGLAAMAIATLWEITSLTFGRTLLLDFLYFTSSVKLVITLFKYFPQFYLNYKLKSVRGFAISTIFLDLTGGIFSLLQLVVSAIYIDHEPSGIWANPGKLGLSLLTLIFDFAFIFQRYILYPHGDESDEQLW